MKNRGSTRERGGEERGGVARDREGTAGTPGTAKAALREAPIAGLDLAREDGERPDGEWAGSEG